MTYLRRYIRYKSISGRYQKRNRNSLSSPNPCKKPKSHAQRPTTSGRLHSMKSSKCSGHKKLNGPSHLRELLLDLLLRELLLLERLLLEGTGSRCPNCRPRVGCCCHRLGRGSCGFRRAALYTTPFAQPYKRESSHESSLRQCSLQGPGREKNGF